MEFKPGNIVRHKATNKRAVVSFVKQNGYVVVTTQDDEKKAYRPEELILVSE